MATDGGGRLVGGRWTLHTPLRRAQRGVVWRATEAGGGRLAVEELRLPPRPEAGGREVEELHLPARPDPGGDGQVQFWDRVATEARAAAALDHPGLIRLDDVVVEDGVVYVATELLDALTLDELIARHGPLAVRRVAQLGLELLDALEAAHTAGLPHLDLRPACVLVTADGRARLAGIGLATLRTGPGSDPASTAFLAPEQVRGDAAGPPADLWSLGAILFLAVEGETPFPGDGTDITRTAILTQPPLTPELAGPLAPALHALLTKPVSGRPTIAETRRLLEPLAGSPRPPAGAGSGSDLGVGGGSGAGVGGGSGAGVGGGSGAGVGAGMAAGLGAAGAEAGSGAPSPVPGAQGGPHPAYPVPGLPVVAKPALTASGSPVLPSPAQAVPGSPVSPSPAHADPGSSGLAGPTRQLPGPSRTPDPTRPGPGPQSVPDPARPGPGLQGVPDPARAVSGPPEGDASAWRGWGRGGIHTPQHNLHTPQHNLLRQAGWGSGGAGGTGYGSRVARNAMDPVVRRVLLIAGGSVVLALVSFAVAVAVTGDPLGLRSQVVASTVATVAPTTVAPPTTAPSTTVTPTTQAPVVPPGWAVHIDPATGYQVAVPPGWQVVSEGPRTELRDVSSPTLLRIDWQQDPQADPVTLEQQAGQAHAGQRGGYQQARLEPAQFKGLPAALLEFTYQDGETWHVLELGFRSPRHHVAMAIYARDRDWGSGWALFEAFKDSFVPPAT